MISRVNSLETNWLRNDLKKSRRNLCAVSEKPRMFVIISTPMKPSEAFDIISSEVFWSNSILANLVNRAYRDRYASVVVIGSLGWFRPSIRYAAVVITLYVP